MLILDVQDDMRFDFEIEFDFRTVRSEAILFYVDVIESDTSIEYIFGYIEVRRLQVQKLYIQCRTCSKNDAYYMTCIL